jgi:hypothetical protein
MNVDRILALADLIESLPKTEIEDDHGFCMVDYRHDCGTPACIAGWAVHLSGEKVDVKGTFYAASTFLGISPNTAYDLFIWAEKRLDQITPDEAANTLRHLAGTGEVRWEFA